MRTRRGCGLRQPRPALPWSLSLGRLLRPGIVVPWSPSPRLFVASAVALLASPDAPGGRPANVELISLIPSSSPTRETSRGASKTALPRARGPCLRGILAAPFPLPVAASVVIPEGLARWLSRASADRSPCQDLSRVLTIRWAAQTRPCAVTMTPPTPQGPPPPPPARSSILPLQMRR